MEGTLGCKLLGLSSYLQMFIDNECIVDHSIVVSLKGNGLRICRIQMYRGYAPVKLHDITCTVLLPALVG